MDAYERLLGDAMAGDAASFAREDYVEEAWRIVDPVLKSGTPVYEYEPNTWGPSRSQPGGVAAGRVAQPSRGAGGWIGVVMKIDVLPDSWSPAPGAGRQRWRCRADLGLPGPASGRGLNGKGQAMTNEQLDQLSKRAVCCPGGPDCNPSEVLCVLPPNGIHEGGAPVSVNRLPELPEDFMSTIAAPDRSPATSSRSASALNLIGGTWVEGRGNTSRDICNPADTAEVLAPGARGRAGAGGRGLRRRRPRLPWLACHSGAGSGSRPVQVPGPAGKAISRTWHTASSAKTASC